MSNSKRKLHETVGMKKEGRGKRPRTGEHKKQDINAKTQRTREMSLVERLSVEYGSTWNGTKAQPTSSLGLSTI